MQYTKRLRQIEQMPQAILKAPEAILTVPEATQMCLKSKTTTPQGERSARVQRKHEEWMEFEGREADGGGKCRICQKPMPEGSFCKLSIY